MRTSLACLALAFPLAFGVGCIMEASDDPHCQLAEADEVDQSAPRYQFVIDSIDIPNTPNEANAFALNLDGDDRGHPDNAIGQIFSTIRDFLEIDMDSAMRLAIERAQLLHLVEVQASSLEVAEGVGATVFIGTDLDDDPNDNFTGQERFAAQVSPDSQPLSGSIENGRLEVRLGTLPLRFAVPRVEEPVLLHLDAARIDARIDGQYMEGVLAGVLSEEEVDEVLFPAIHASIVALVERDCLAGECYPATSGATILAQFDEDRDGTIGLEELRTNILMGALFSPDLDMLDADRDVRPLCDGARESYSVGLAFTAVPAHF